MTNTYTRMYIAQHVQYIKQYSIQYIRHAHVPDLLAPEKSLCSSRYCS